MSALILPVDRPGWLEEASRVLGQGDLVVIPTDTVYGIAANVHNAEAIQKLFHVKGRPADKAIPVLIGQEADLDKVASGVPAQAEQLMQRFWPGALTLILPRRDDMPAALGPGNTVGVRMPDHPIALKLLSTPARWRSPRPISRVRRSRRPRWRSSVSSGTVCSSSWMPVRALVVRHRRWWNSRLRSSEFSGKAQSRLATSNAPHVADIAGINRTLILGSYFTHVPMHNRRCILLFKPAPRSSELPGADLFFYFDRRGTNLIADARQRLREAAYARSC